MKKGIGVCFINLFLLTGFMGGLTKGKRALWDWVKMEDVGLFGVVWAKVILTNNIGSGCSRIIKRAKVVFLYSIGTKSVNL